LWNKALGARNPAHVAGCPAFALRDFAINIPLRFTAFAIQTIVRI
jgi:hypothetical protein